MSTYYYLSHTVDKEPLRERGWTFREYDDGEYDEVNLLAIANIEGNDYCVHLYLDDDTKEIMAFDRYGAHWPAAAKMVHDLCDLGFEFNNMEAEKVVYDEYVLQDLWYEQLKKGKDESNGNT